MMRPSLPPAPGGDRPPCSSIFDAIKDDDWEGLLTLYTTTAYDAVHSAEFARRGGGFDGGGGFHRQRSSPSFFRDEKKMEGAASHQGLNNKKPSPALGLQSSTSIRELDLLVREIIGADAFDEHHDAGCGSDAFLQETPPSHRHRGEEKREGQTHTSKPKPPPQSPQRGHANLHSNKKTRLHHQHSSHLSPPFSAGKFLPRGSSSTPERAPFHGHYDRSSSSLSPHAPSGSSSRGAGRRERDIDLEKIMWDSASVLSNGRPSPGFVARRRDRDRREREAGLTSACKTEEGEKEDEKEKERSNAPIFEGSVANATPADHHHVLDGTHPLDPHTLAPLPALPPPGGSGTAQHLACLLDSPLALALLVCLGADPGARHTAFRRLAAHEAACADSPRCLELLVGAGAGGYSGCRRGGAGTAARAGGVRGAGPSPPRPAAKNVESDFDSSAPVGRPSFPGQVEGKKRRSPKTSKKKLSLFAGWHNKGDGKASGASGDGASSESSSVSKKSPPEDRQRRIASPPLPESASFPAALRVMWEAVKLLRLGLVNEMDAARHVLDRVKLSNQSLAVLALQCPRPLPPAAAKQPQRSNAMATATSSPFASIPGLPSAVHQLFQPLASPNGGHHVHEHAQPPIQRGNVDGHGNTPLHWAAFKNSVRAMGVLLSPGADGDPDAARRVVNVRAQPSGWTPLHDAAYSDSADAVSCLIAAGADVDARSHSGATPLCFAAQEDAPDAARRLLEAGADPAARCLGNVPGANVRANNADQTGQFHSRFSGYTPLHYCAHYNASRAARVLLEHAGVGGGRLGCSLSHPLRAGHGWVGGADLLEIPDLNDKLPIHVAAARGSSGVLRELLHGGARLETRASRHVPSSPRPSRRVGTATGGAASSPLAIPRTAAVASNRGTERGGVGFTSPNNSPDSVASPAIHHTPVSSPILRAMIPSQPIQSSKPWNCLSQKNIDACRHLIHEAEMNWTPGRHGLFAPADRAAVVEVLRVGKRLERMDLSEGLGCTEGVGRGIFLDLWPRVLSYCGRGWFQPENVEGERESEEEEGIARGNGRGCVDGDNEDEISMQSSNELASRADETMEGEFTQFQLDEASDSMAAIL